MKPSDLRDNWAVAVLDCLATKYRTPSIADLEGRIALGKALGVSTAEVGRASSTTSIKTLAQWAADHNLIVMQDGHDVLCTERPETPCEM